MVRARWTDDRLQGYQDALTPGFYLTSEQWEEASEEYRAGYEEGMKFYMPH